MAKEEINSCLQEILKDENGNVIDPTCGMEKLLCLICENMSSGGGGTSGEVSAITTAEIDEIMSQ